MRVWLISLFMLIISMPFSISYADIPSTEQKLALNKDIMSDNFGTAVAVSGDFAVIGAKGDDTDGENAGAVYIFKSGDKGWVEQQKLTAPDGGKGFHFGFSVAISGNTAVVGATDTGWDPWFAEYGYRPGAAYVFFRQGDKWVQQARLTAPNPAANDYFGSYVAVSGNTIVVGGTGEVYIFMREAGAWTLLTELEPPDSETPDSFGYPIAFADNTIVVSGRFKSGQPGANQVNDSGIIHVFKRKDGTWSHQAELTYPVGDASDGSSRSLAVSGDYVVVGEKSDYDNGWCAGAVYVFKQENGTWETPEKITPSDGEKYDFFGSVVAVSGNYIIAGAPWTEPSPYDIDMRKGSAYVFKRENGTWHEMSRLNAYGSEEGYYSNPFGYAVAVADGHALIGAELEGCYAYKLTDTDGQCTVKIQQDLSFQMTNAVYQSPTGDQHLWVSFKYLGESNGKLHWILTHVGPPDLSSCTTVIGPDLRLNLSNATYESPSFGKQAVWAEFEYTGTRNGLLTWEMTGSGGK